jgi:hypothetical protein
MSIIRRDSSVCENVSVSGTRVKLEATPPEFDFVRVSYAKSRIERLADMRNRYTGSDGYERLCLRFIRFKPS